MGAITEQGFRQAFPEFKDAQVYTSEAYGFWSALAPKFCSQAIFDDGTTSSAWLLAQYLYIGHNMTIGKRDAEASAKGGTPGDAKGPKTSISIDKVSASYDVKAISNEAAGFLNSTSYGMRLWDLYQLFGAGGIQLGAGGYGPGGLGPTPWGYGGGGGPW